MNGTSSPSEKILAELVSIGTTEDASTARTPKLSAGYRLLKELAELIHNDGPEEEFQIFLATHPQFLMGAFGSRDDGDLALIEKPKLGSKYVADFGLVKFGQGGAGIHLIELEHPRDRLFTAGLTPTQKLAHAQGQILSWVEWLSKYGEATKKQLIDHAMALPEFTPGLVQRGGFRFVTTALFEQRWNAFGGNDHNIYSYSVVIGRWTRMNDAERKRLIAQNVNPNPASIMTYDQLARKALVRPDVYEF